jgi:hypothetical protein
MACGRFSLSQYSGEAARQLGSLAPAWNKNNDKNKNNKNYFNLLLWQ